MIEVISGTTCYECKHYHLDELEIMDELGTTWVSKYYRCSENGETLRYREGFNMDCPYYKPMREIKERSHE